MASADIIDSRGRPCPLPVIDLAKAIAGVDVGSEVRLLADDPGARADIPAWCRMRGHQMQRREEHGGHDVFVIVRSH